MALDSAALLAWLEKVAGRLHEQRAYLTDLDAAIGDADHGVNMDRGFTAVMAKLKAEGAPHDVQDVGAILKTVGATLVSTVGGASGPLYGTAFLRAGMALAGKTALEPAVNAFSAALADGKDKAAALAAAADAAEEGVRATIPMLATKGRASYLGERSKDHQDPGATSTALMLRAAAGEG